MDILAGVKKTEAILVLRPESAELLRAIPSRKKQALNPRSFCLIGIPVQRCIDWMRRGKGEEAWLEISKGRKISLKRKFSMPILRNSLPFKEF